MRLINKLLLVFILILGSVSFTHAQQANTLSSSANNSTLIKTKVKGISCSKDLKMISDSVVKLKGVTSCEPGKKGTTTTFEIYFDPALVTEKQIHEAIQNTGSCENPSERPYKVKIK